MKKVIIYGVKNLELRREIENFLDDDYEIVGYSDGHYSWDIWDGKRFIRPEDLCHQQFDWILLNAASDKNRAEMRRLLMDLGIPAEEIINPTMFLSGAEAKTRPDFIADIDTNYHGEKRLIFGLSYSVWGINDRLMKYPVYDCSIPSLDLYYNFKLYSYMERKWGPFSGLQTVLWVFPYYYFDYDVSRSMELHKRGHLFSMWRLDDWHNYQDVPELHDYVENYRMFGDKITRFYHAPKESYQLLGVCGDPKGSATLPRLFFSDHEKTEVENREIFIQFYKKIEEAGGKPVLVIPPYYMDAVDERTKRAFYQKKEKFYRILKELEPEIGSVRVLDCSEQYAGQRELFADVRHLNEAGAREFTELINRELL